MNEGPILDTQAQQEDFAVFLSYSRVDLVAARPLIALLEAHGFSVWWDGMLEAGVRYVERTEHALERAAAVVVLWSAQAVSSHWVRDEAMAGRDTNRLVPVTLDGTLPPLGFRQFQVLNFATWNGDPQALIARQLIEAIEALQQSAAGPFRAPAVATAPVVPGPAAHMSRRKSLTLLGLGAGTIALGGAGFAVWRSMAPSGQDALNSIAVLPFANDSGNPALDYVPTGLANELRALLLRNRALRVVARSSSEAVVRRGLDAVSAANELGVAYTVEGAVQVVDGIVSLSVDLIDGKSGVGTWAQSFRKPLAAMLDLQHDLARAIADALSLNSADGRMDRLPGEATVPAAYNAYLQGLDTFVRAEDADGTRAALRLFQSAARLDPGFAGAQAGIATCNLDMGHGAETPAAADSLYRAAVEAANKAMTLGPDLALSHSLLGQIQFEAQLKIAEARRPYEQAIALEPGDAGHQVRYAEYAALTGDDAAAKKAIAIALANDPLNPLIYKSAALVEYAARRYDSAIDFQRKALAQEKGLRGSRSWIGSAMIQQNRAQAALAECTAEPSVLLGSPCRAIAAHRLGQRAAADAAMAQLVEQYGDAGAYQQAQVRAQWGEADAAMAALQVARRLGDAGLTYLRMDPMLDPLRQRPDFIRLQRDLGFR